MVRKKFEDETNIKAAAQEAQERKLKRKNILRDSGTKKSIGVSFNEVDENEGDDVVEVADSDSEVIGEETPSLESENAGKQRTIKIRSDGTYVGTSVYIGAVKLKHPDISIRISEKTGIKVIFVKEESLF